MKVYEKPRVYIERFELSQHIASCAWDMNAQSVDNCSATSDPEWGLPDGIIAFNDENVCKDGPLESYCYTNGSSENNIFNS